MTFTVAELCLKHNLSLSQLAEQSNLPEDRVTAIAMGRWTPSPEERNRIAAAFDVEKDEISWGHQTPIQHIYGHGPG